MIAAGKKIRDNRSVRGFGCRGCLSMLDAGNSSCTAAEEKNAARGRNRIEAKKKKMSGVEVVEAKCCRAVASSKKREATREPKVTMLMLDEKTRLLIRIVPVFLGSLSCLSSYLCVFVGQREDRRVEDPDAHNKTDTPRKSSESHGAAKLDDMGGAKKEESERRWDVVVVEQRKVSNTERKGRRDRVAKRKTRRE